MRERTVCYGPLRWWNGVPVKLDPFVDQHFEVRMYGVGFWMFPLIFSVLVWRKRP